MIERTDKQYGLQGGFTLIEMMVVIVLLVLTAGITTHYLVSASRLYLLLLAQRQADDEVAGAVSRMQREARVHVQTLTANSDRWRFVNIYDITNTFRWTGSYVNLNGKRLAQDVCQFSLSYYDTTNGLLGPLPLSAAKRARIHRVALDLKVANNLADSELKLNFFLQEDILK